MVNGKIKPLVLPAKLHRPQVTDDLVRRGRLCRQMDMGHSLPLTLVSAPAGYGKSMLVSNWADGLEIPCAWLSLDDSDSELDVFLSYFLAAVNSVFPDSCPTVQAFLGGGDLPPLLSIGHALIGDLDMINEPFVLVLDDYHQAGNLQIDELIRILLSHPPRGLHLVLVTRRDPALSLSALRGRGWMNEVRLNDLEFTLPETEAFLTQSLSIDDSKATLQTLHEKIEGWPVGLRLIKLALIHNDDPDRLLAGMSDGFGSAQQFLLSEVLAQQPANMRMALLKSSILDRFCAPLCDAVFSADEKSQLPDVGGNEFLHTINHDGLFSIPLGISGHWFRFHHQFQDLLRGRLDSECSCREIAALHIQASAWFESEGLIDEALTYSLILEDKSVAVRLVLENSGDLLLTEQNIRLESWLRKLPDDVIENEPMLIVLSGYMHHIRYRLPEWETALRRADARIDAMDPPAGDRARLKSCVDAIRSSYCFFDSDLEGAINYAQSAIKHVPSEFLRLKIHAVAVLGLSLQFSGRQEEAFPILDKLSAEPEYQGPEARAMLASTFCAICMLACRLPEMKQSAMRVQHAAKRSSAAVYKLYGRLYLAIPAYFCNELDNAEHQLGLEISNPQSHHNLVVVDWAAVLILTHLARSRSEEALAIANQVSDYGLEINSSPVTEAMQALQAEIHLRCGRIDQAMNWAETYQSRELKPQLGFYLPELTLARVLVSGSSKAHWARAEEVLADVEQYARSTHFRTALISALCLKALLLEQGGENEKALEVLAEALGEAEPGHGLRFFLDLGKPMAGLLKQLQTVNGDNLFIRHLLHEFSMEEKPGPSASPAQETTDPVQLEEPLGANSLTPRELDILELLARRFRDKEIANQLFISPETVKSHLKNIYQKFAVSNRLQAVARARALNLFTPDN